MFLYFLFVFVFVLLWTLCACSGQFGSKGIPMQFSWFAQSPINKSALQGLALFTRRRIILSLIMDQSTVTWQALFPNFIFYLIFQRFFNCFEYFGEYSNVPKIFILANIQTFQRVFICFKYFGKYSNDSKVFTCSKRLLHCIWRGSHEGLPATGYEVNKENIIQFFCLNILKSNTYLFYQSWHATTLFEPVKSARKNS